MSMPIGRTQTPDGVRDRLPREAARVRSLTGRLAAIFQAWAYHEVITPGFEYLETVTAGAGLLGRREDLYQLFDRKGRTLALRPDMTTPIARLVATKLVGEPMPLRLSYFAPVYRHRDSKAGSLGEIWQAGIELIGASGAAADAEVIALACAALEAAGVKGVKLGLGHVDFVEGIFRAVDLPQVQEQELKDALVAHDLVSFAKGVADAGLSPSQAELLSSLATFQGTISQACDRFTGVANEQVDRALQQLATTLALLEQVGVAEQVSLDLGLVRSLDYYTGVVFEGYAPGVGSPVMGGGRYDNLLTAFGGDAPATGFALEMDRLLAALDRQSVVAAELTLDVIVACPPGSEAQAMTRARQLRALGLTVEVDLLGRQGEALTEYARLRGARSISAPDATAAVGRLAQQGRATCDSIH
jgi:ATP phosphoribosyltransferase regulatory subunit